jgi:hypothetical protein
LSDEGVQVPRKENAALRNEVDAPLERLEIAQGRFGRASDALLPRQRLVH